MFRRSLHRSVNWGKLLTRMDSEEAKARASMLRVYYAQIENLERKYPSAPAAIDWEAFKSTVQTPGVVEDLQKSFSALGYDLPDPEDFEGMLANHTANKKALQNDVSSLESSIKSLEDRVAFEEANKTDETTTLKDWAEKYPELYAEAEAEVARHEWFSGVVTPYEQKESNH